MTSDRELAEIAECCNCDSRRKQIAEIKNKFNETWAANCSLSTENIKLEAKLQKSKQREAVLLEAVENLLGFFDGECYFDHHGDCQAHGSFGEDHGCDVADARQALEKHKELLDE